ncbi:MAG: hypothetical protein JO119_10685 [Acidobacteria bacterium]|nr:hypothetical protein [Acidobacteriota bacterium]
MPRNPDLNAQRAAMQKLAFLVGKWNGEVRLLHGPDQDLHQTEEVQYKLDGLVLVIEGIGRRKSDGQPVIQALGMISFDDENGTYRMRAFNGGRFLESEVKLLDPDKAIGWGFVLGEIMTNSVLRIDENGDWTELAEITIGSDPPKKLLELTVRRVA